jgi:hypothetical protein
LVRILYIGADWGNSGLRAEALRRIGHQVDLLSPMRFLPSQPIIGRAVRKFIHEFGAMALEPYIRWRLMHAIGSTRYDVAWIDSGELLGPITIRGLRRHACHIVNYNTDDPFGGRDRNRFGLFCTAVPEYDLLAVCRVANIDEAYAHGAAKVIRVWMSADEIAHAPLDLGPGVGEVSTGEVVFVGTWMPERGPFMARLLELGVPVKIYGDRWAKAPEWPNLMRAFAGPAVYDREYVRIIQRSKVCLGLLSKGNRDLHTRRSAEIPYAGGLLCAERTEEHRAMYKEDEEAIFWSTPEECAAKCHDLLGDPIRRQQTAAAGRARCLRSGLTNEKVVSQILEQIEIKR